MNEPDANLDMPSDTSTRALQEEVQALRVLVWGLLFAMIILSGCINVYLKRQVSIVRAQADAIQKSVEDFQTVRIPWGLELWRRLNEYERTHPDFKPITDKYNGFFAQEPQQAPPKK